jgi:hypothetical protein
LEIPGREVEIDETSTAPNEHGDILNLMKASSSLAPVKQRERLVALLRPVSPGAPPGGAPLLRAYLARLHDSRRDHFGGCVLEYPGRYVPPVLT